MSLAKTLKIAVANILLPIARFYIRYSPFSAFKPFLWRYFSWRAHSYTVRTRFGAVMSGQSNDLLQGYIYYFGMWEPNLTDFIRSRLADHSHRTFIDVGANMGYFTLLGSRLLSQGQVVAIEAFPSIYDKLVTNVRLNRCSNVRTVPFAATETTQQISMFHADQGNESATTSAVGVFSSAPTIVEGKSLADLLTATEISCARLIKIDVEGAEYSVVRGMLPILAMLPADAELIIELTPSILGDDRLRYILDTFEAAGYHPYLLNNPYSPDYYMFSHELSRPTRMTSPPTSQSDVVFSRINAEHLSLDSLT
jgi:FkbM family methyltransferase